MRKVIAVLLLVGLLGIASLVHAERNVRLVVNGAEVPCNPAPLIYQDRVFVPVRFVAEAMGARVGWDDATSTVQVQTVLTDAEFAKALLALQERYNSLGGPIAQETPPTAENVWRLADIANSILVELHALPKPASDAGREALYYAYAYWLSTRELWASGSLMLSKAKESKSESEYFSKEFDLWMSVQKRMAPIMERQVQVLLGQE